VVYIVDRPHLQLALDVLDLDLAIAIALDAEDYVDIIEAGTPLINYNGIEAVRRLKQRFGVKPVAADLKIADAADIEVAMARDAGATLVSVLASAPFETMRLAVEKAHGCGLKVIADLLGVDDEVAKVRELERVGVDFVLVHSGLDEQRQGRVPFGDLERLATATNLTLGIAGGIQVGDIPRIRNIPKLGLVVVGSAITQATQPGEVARQFREALNR
jgi:3-hexulose-6-phosphate synthase / 6-phospho-3-hexuloisomerase